MDPNVKPGSRWPQLPKREKLEILRRYRDLCEKREETFLTAQDFFIEQVLENDLVEEHMNQIANNGLA